MNLKNNSLMLGVFILLGTSTGLVGCRSTEILPEKVEVKVSRDDPAKDCKPLGTVTGKAMSTKGTSTEALEDLKTDAARKGANYVQYEQASALGTALRGTAYYCP